MLLLGIPGVTVPVQADHGIPVYHQHDSHFQVRRGPAVPQGAGDRDHIETLRSPHASPYTPYGNREPFGIRAYRPADEPCPPLAGR